MCSGGATVEGGRHHGGGCGGGPSEGRTEGLLVDLLLELEVVVVVSGLEVLAEVQVEELLLLLLAEVVLLLVELLQVFARLDLLLVLGPLGQEASLARGQALGSRAAVGEAARGLLLAGAAATCLHWSLGPARGRAVEDVADEEGSHLSPFLL